MYVSIDIETTGLDPVNNQILKIAAVVDVDKTTPIKELPSFVCRIIHEEIVGQPYALALNAHILKDLANVPTNTHVERYKDIVYYSPEFAMYKLDEFLQEHFKGKGIVVAGKNFASFDKAFLDNIQQLKFSHRTIDIGNLFLTSTDNDKIPNLQECLKRAGIIKEIAHTALEDAQDVIKCYRCWYSQN